jgi:hypothetical protein
VSSRLLSLCTLRVVVSLRVGPVVDGGAMMRCCTGIADLPETILRAGDLFGYVYVGGT